VLLLCFDLIFFFFVGFDFFVGPRDFSWMVSGFFVFYGCVVQCRMVSFIFFGFYFLLFPYLPLMISPLKKKQSKKNIRKLGEKKKLKKNYLKIDF